MLTVLAGGVAGAAVGFFAGRARVCSVAGCNVKANMIASILGWAFFGAAVAWAFTR